MKYSLGTRIAVFFITIGIVLTGVGGYMDMIKKDSIDVPFTEFAITKQHLWNDGSFFLFLGTASKIILG